MSPLCVVQFFIGASYSSWGTSLRNMLLTLWPVIPHDKVCPHHPLLLSLGCALAGGACQGVERPFPSHKSPLGGSCRVQPFPAQAGSLGLAEAEMFLECECRILCDLGWETAHLATPLPQWRPKINIAQIASPSNKQSVKIAELPLRLRLIKVGSDCRSQSLLGVCSNEAFAAPWRHGKNMKWHNLQRLYH